jgi:hypothetical protein
MDNQLVSEIDVLIGITKWLISKGWQVEVLSIPHGQGINSAADRNKLETELTKVGMDVCNIKFIASGEDIRAKQGNNIWKIECKGLTSGKNQTVKNNFDRAVASVVSYYTKSEDLQLGLALPDAEEYKRFIRARLPKALREAIKLWVFLYCTKDEVYEFAPNEEIPS